MSTSLHLQGLRQGLSRRLLIDEDHACFSLSPQALESLLRDLEAGADVAKYGHSGTPLPRRLRLSSTRDSVFYEGATRKALGECTLRLRDLDAVLQGQHTSLFAAAKREGRVAEACCLSLVSASGRPRRTLDVAFASAELARAWHTGLTALLIALRISEEDSDTRALRRAFGAACARAGTAALQSALQLLPMGSMPSILPRGLGQRLAAREPQLMHVLSAVQGSAEEGSGSGSGSGGGSAEASSPRPSSVRISLPEVLQFIDRARGEERKDIQALFYSLLGGSAGEAGEGGPAQQQQQQQQQQQRRPGLLSCAALAAFLRESQGWSEATEEDAQQLCLYWEKSPLLQQQQAAAAPAAPAAAPQPPPGMSLHAFAAWLTSSFNSAQSPAATLPEACDMTQPLTAYWIESSHNTYLEAGQLYGPSSTAPYLHALCSGCRCLEMDVWDGPGGEPRVYHGGTLTTAVPFEDVARALSAAAFRGKAGEAAYPLVLSLEMHACSTQQQRVADILAACFGERLLLYDGSAQGGAQRLLPSPLQLRGRVIVKSKLKAWKEEAAQQQSPQQQQQFLLPQAGAGALLAPSLLSLVYLRGVPWRQLLAPGDAAAARSASSSPHIMASLKDGKLDALLRQWHSYSAAGGSGSSGGGSGSSNSSSSGAGAAPASAAASPPPPPDVSSITRTHLLRVYPGPLHFTSSNFSPCRFWAAGVQMTALNYQTQDCALRLQRAWFKQNGRCGYVLKPAYLRPAGEGGGSGGGGDGGGGGGAGASGGSEGPPPAPAPAPASPPLSSPSSCEDLQQALAGAPGSKDLLRKSLVSRARVQMAREAAGAGGSSAGGAAGGSAGSNSAASARGASSSSSSRSSGSGSSGSSHCPLFPRSLLDALPPPPGAGAAQCTLCLTLLGAQNLPTAAAAAPAGGAVSSGSGSGSGSGAGAQPPPPQAWLQWTVHVFGEAGDERRVALRPIASLHDACAWPAAGGGGGGGGVAREGEGGQLRLPLRAPAVASLYIELHAVGSEGGGAGAGGGGQFLAYAALPLPSARRGYRALSLRGASGKKLPLCTLLCNLQLVGGGEGK